MRLLAVLLEPVPFFLLLVACGALWNLKRRWLRHESRALSLLAGALLGLAAAILLCAGGGMGR